MLVNDMKEIGTFEYRLSSNLYGYKLNSPKVVVDSVCIVKPFTIRSRGSRIPQPLQGCVYASLQQTGGSLRTLCLYM